MRRRTTIHALGLAIAIFAAVFAGVLPLPASARPLVPTHIAPSGQRVQVGQEAWQLFRATNTSRGRFGAPKLQLNRAMSQVAKHHSMAMAAAGSLFHTADVDVYLHGVHWHVWGENVGFTPGDVASVQQAFMDSPPHRANILNHAFRHVAIGAVRVDGTLWVTVFFYA